MKVLELIALNEAAKKTIPNIIVSNSMYPEDYFVPDDVCPNEIQIPEKFAPLLLTKRREKWLPGGRASGKSRVVTNAAVKLSCGFAQRYMPPLRIMIVRLTNNSMTESVKYGLRMCIENHGQLSNFKETNSSFLHKNGSKFIYQGFYGSEGVKNSIKSIEDIDVVIIEEADDIKEPDWVTLLASIRKQNSEIWCIFNPTTVRTAAWKRYQAAKADPNMFTVFTTYKDNLALSETGRKDIERMKRTNYELYEHTYLGKPREFAQGVIFSGHYAIRPDRPEHIPECRPEDRMWGMDFGSNHVLIGCFIKDYILYVDREYYFKEKSYSAIVSVMRDKIDGWHSLHIYADSADPQAIRQFKAFGFAGIRGVRKGRGSVQQGINFIQGMEQMIVSEKCENLIKELGLYSRKKNSFGEFITEPIDEYNHSIDALRYALCQRINPTTTVKGINI